MVVHLSPGAPVEGHSTASPSGQPVQVLRGHWTRALPLLGVPAPRWSPCQSQHLSVGQQGLVVLQHEARVAATAAAAVAAHRVIQRVAAT